MKLFNPLSLIFKLHKKLTDKEEDFVYVALGDSTVEGLGASKPERTFPYLVHTSLRVFFKKSNFFNLGKAGWTTQDVINTQLDEAIKQKPNLVTISVGANDIFQRVSPKTFQHRLETIVNKFQNETNALIVINTIPDLAQARVIPYYLKPYCKIMVNHYNKIIKSLAKDEKILIVDIFTQSKIFAESYPEFIGEDGLHPSDSGYALWANSIISQLQRYIFPQKKLAFSI